MGVLAHIQKTGDPAGLMQVDAWAWAKYGKLKLQASLFQTAGHEYLVEPLQDVSRRQCCKKSTQTGWTETYIIKILHNMRYQRYPLGALYLFPTQDEVTDFSASRFKPLLKSNHKLIGRYVKSTNRSNLKEIGKGFLYFRGARLGQKMDSGDPRKSIHKLKGIPVDACIFDEFDEMPKGAKKPALGRMKHSFLKEEYYLANPTVPGWGVDATYNESDQRVWMIQCMSCGKETCLEIEFPAILKRQKDGTVKKVCRHCEKEIFTRNGYWVARYPDKSKDMVGRWISHLNSAYIDLKDFLEEYESPKTDMTEFMNLGMGMAHIAAENQLTSNDVRARCTEELMQPTSTKHCAMGVDVGKLLHCVIGEKVHSKYLKIIKMARVPSFNDVRDLARKFNVRSTVFDLYPETRKVRNYRGAERFKVFGCEYMENQRGSAAWNHKTGVVTVNRTEICDATHEIMTKEGRCTIPRENAEVEEYIKEMCAIAKVLQTDEETGKKKYFYKKVGDADHYRHATNYLFLAALKLRPQSLKGDVEEIDYVYD